MSGISRWFGSHRALQRWAGCLIATCAAGTLTAAQERGWLVGAHDAAGSYYSPLRRIDTANVRALGYAWSYDLKTTHGIEATPIVVDGVMYLSAPWGAVHALDARTGGGLWAFEPKIDQSVTRKVCCGIVNRGLSFAKGRVFVAAIDGHLIALNAKNGSKAWDVDSIVDHERGYTVTGSTYIAGDLVIIGNSGAELDARGYFSAYRIADGSLAWRFYTVPASTTGPFENPELQAAAHTWDPASRFEVGLGGTVWDGMAYDPALQLLYVGTGNAALYPRKLRSPAGGDNLYLASILAIHAKTGRLAWYYQTTPGDQWDYTATQKMILAELKIAGKQRSVLMQAPKNGFFYVLDRKSGKLLSAVPYVPVNWATHVDRATGRPDESAQGDYSDGPRLVFPSPAGGHNWQPMAFNPHTGLVYIPVQEAPAAFWIPPTPFVYEKGAVNTGAMYAFPAKNAGDWGLEGQAARDLPPLAKLAEGQPDTTLRGYLRAWDPITNRVAWQVETSGEWAGQMSALANGGGVMTSAGGLVFQGRSTGYLHVFRATDGQELATLNLGTGIMAAPMSYELDGIQYIAVAAGYGGALGGVQPPGTAAQRYGNAARIVALKLGGTSVPLPAERASIGEFPHPAVERFGTVAQIEHGNQLLKRHCSRCHANSTGGAVPDLRRASTDTHAQFENIVLAGARAERGMGAFKAILSSADAQDIRAAVVDSAWRAYEAAQGTPQAAPHQPADGAASPSTENQP